MKTISSSSPFFCSDKVCKYYVTVETHKVDYFIFGASLVRKGATLDVGSDLMGLDELEPSEEVFYHLDLPRSGEALRVSVTPVEGEVSSFVHLSESEDELGSFFFSSWSAKRTQILIGEKGRAAFWLQK